MQFGLIYMVFDGKASPLFKNLVLFQIKCNQKQWLQVQIYEKYLKYKDDFKKPVGAFIQKLWVNLQFQISVI